MEKKKTISSIFLVPTLKIDRDSLRNNEFINAFIKQKGKEISDDCVLLLFKPSDFDRFKEFVDSEYERTDKLIEDYDLEGGYVILVYKLDDKFKEDFDLVKKGKYSKTSDKFKKLFPQVVKIVDSFGKHKDEVSLQWRIFKKTEDLRLRWEEKIGIDFKDDMELWGGFDEEEETLDTDKL